MTLSTVIADTRKAVDEDPGVARALFSAEGTLTGVTEVEVRTPTHSFTVDEPPALGGGGTAPNPVEYALASLGSCQAITYRFWAEQLGVSFDKLTVTVEGDLDIRRFLGFDESVRPASRRSGCGSASAGRRAPNATRNWPPRWTSTARCSTCSATPCRSIAPSRPANAGSQPRRQPGYRGITSPVLVR